MQQEIVDRKRTQLMIELDDVLDVRAMSGW